MRTSHVAHLYRGLTILGPRGFHITVESVSRTAGGKYRVIGRNGFGEGFDRSYSPSTTFEVLS